MVKIQATEVALACITQQRLDQKRPLQKLLVAVEESTFAPTHWAFGDARLRKYDRTELVAQVLNVRKLIEDDLILVRLVKRTEPKCEIVFDAVNAIRRGERDRSSIREVKLEIEDCPSEELMRDVFEFGDAIARLLQVEMATAHPIFDRTDMRRGNCNGSRIHDGNLIDQFGLATGLSARTWFGPHALEVIGLRRLRQCGIVSELDWGGVRVDLVEEPWTASYNKLDIRTRETLAIMKKAKLIGDCESFFHTEWQAAKNWKPFPKTNEK